MKASRNRSTARPGEATRLPVAARRSGRGPVERALDLQAQAGNRAVTRLVQARLLVGPSNDPSEREADRMAAQVMRALSMGPGPVTDHDLERDPPEGPVRRSSSDDPLGGMAVDPSTEHAIGHAGSGSALPSTLRSRMESAFGADFGSVRVHHGPRVAELSRSLQAEAFTSGRDVFFGRGAYRPHTPSGQELLAHELTHVLQQTGGSRPRAQRQMLDTDFEDEVFEIEAAKRQAQVADMNMSGSRIGTQDPRRQNLEQFFSDPSNRKGTRSYPAVGPGPAGPRAGRPGSQPNTTLPDVLVVGPDASVSPRLPEQATGEGDIQAHFDALTGSDPTLVPLLDPIRLKALGAVEDVGRGGIRKVTYGAGGGGDAAKLTERVTAIVAAFKRDAARAVEQREWEGTVAARNAFVASKANAPMATRALDRANQDVAQAGAIYHTLYEVLAFDEAGISRLAATSSEAAMLDLSTVIPAPSWAAFLTAVTQSDALLAFAPTQKAALAGVANAASVVPVWQADPTHVTSVADANTILSLGLVNQDVAKGVAAARLLGSLQVPDIATLSAIDAGGQITSMNNLTLYVGVGGHVLATKGMRALPDGPKLPDVKAFNLKAGRNPAEASASWALLQANVTDDQKKVQIIKSVVKADSAGLADFNRLVTNWAALSDRTTINSGTVASLVRSGLIVPRGKIYDSGTWGRGCVYVFELAGQGRLFPEWHLHFNFGKKTVVAGAGWKNQDEKYGSGVKTFGSAPDLEKAIAEVGKWLAVRP